MKRYWLAHTRGCNFDFLRKKGFTTFYPTMDDYVFLEVTDKHKPLLKKQTELAVAFVKARNGEHATISQRELDAMAGETVHQLDTGKRVLIVEGPASNLAGEIISKDGNLLTVRAEGFKRTYDVEVDVQNVVPEPLDKTGGDGIMDQKGESE